MVACNFTDNQAVFTTLVPEMYRYSFGGAIQIDDADSDAEVLISDSMFEANTGTSPVFCFLLFLFPVAQP